MALELMLLFVSAFAVISGFGLILLGFQRTGDALEHVLDGRRSSWFSVGAWFSLALLGAGIASGVVTFWVSAYG